MSSYSQPPKGPARRHGSTLVALLIGAALAAGILAFIHHGPLRHQVVFRYVQHPVQWVEVLFFCCGLGALLTKVLQHRSEHAAFEDDILPRWDGKPLPVERATELRASVERQPSRLQGTFLVRRIRAVVEFLCQRKSAGDLDDHLRQLSDTDVTAHENSFALVRFITWAIPILGFLGTVIGITGAIAGVDTGTLETSLDMVTGGLAEAFDSTALALGLTMVLMFVTFLVERMEQSLLEDVDRTVERQLGHRFLREGTDSGPFLQVVQQSTQALTAAVEGLVQKQADVWANALQEPERRAVGLLQQIQQQLTASLAQALDQTIDAYAQRLSALEQQMLQQSGQVLAHIERVAEGVASQAGTLVKLHEDAAQVTHLQSALQQNLSALADAGAFEEAVHSLTAAVHLLTARVGGGAPRHLPRDKAA